MSLRNIRIRILALILLILIPISLIKIHGIQERYNLSMESELNSSEESASVIASTFSCYIRGIGRTQNVVGTTILSNSSWNQEDIEDYLEKLRPKDSRITGYAWLSPKGEVLASTGAISQNSDYVHEEYIQEIIYGSEMVVSNLKENDDRPVISIAQSIRANNELKGIMIAYLDVEKIESFFTTERRATTSSYGIVDKNGYIVFRKGSPEISFENRKISEDSPAWRALDGEIVRTEAFKSNIDNDLRTGVDYPIESMGWANFVTMSTDELLAMKNKSVQDELLMFFGVFFLLLILVIRLSYGLVSSMNKLVQTSKDIMQGNLNAKTNFTSENPLAIVGQTFDQMTEELNQRIKEIEEYNELKDQFLSTVSHELKTPLNIILGSNQLMEQLDHNNMESWNVNIKKYLKMQKQNCYRLLRLINNLIDVTKAENHHLRAHPINRDITKTVEDITMSIVGYADLKNINVVFDTEVEEKIMSFDEDLIERIMLNILSNAIKFTGEGGEIQVTIYDRKEIIAISIKDNGIGIPEDKTEIIFDRFAQVDSTLSREFEGSGIGLALVKYLVELHDGKISVVSKFGEGSEFIIELPVKLTDNEYIVSNGNDFLNVERIKIEFSDIYVNSSMLQDNTS
ncbi:integral membrane sensor signal transduction histidine kinase [Alkaliphilus metalliredigens QYMF]|uniref:histidine kinase n=1 Tax=Alkaliphilus metalliredigens (strain QYMF) TaxID=293826 RepID=A6TWB6_ALKMQ|nr:sensor histidine kinase [Alkaliphilus metalliredigens]ABR50484.1 integral membrane sensor signal transduction histidine kinase [Alkaliphilus metalliredigens QYMF]